MNGGIGFKRDNKKLTFIKKTENSGEQLSLKGHGTWKKIDISTSKKCQDYLCMYWYFCPFSPESCRIISRINTRRFNKL